MSLFKKKKKAQAPKTVKKTRQYDREERITLQKMVTTIPVTRKMLSQDLLIQAIQSFIGKNVNMGAAAANAVNVTCDPEVFFTNLQLVEDCTRRVADLEPYWTFEGKQPSEQLAEIVDNKIHIIGAFIERSFFDTFEKVKKKSSPRSKEKIFDEYQKKLLTYESIIGEEGCAFFKQLCDENL